MDEIAALDGLSMDLERANLDKLRAVFPCQACAGSI